MRLLDLGCGSGAAAEYFGRRRSVDITCVTNSSIQGEICRGKFQKFGGRLRVVVADFDDLSLPDASFDAIYAFESIGYSKDLDAWLSRCRRMRVVRRTPDVCGPYGQHDIVAVAEHERFRSTPDDLLKVHHRAHSELEFPQIQVLKEVPGQAPGPERQVAIPDGAESEPAQLKNQDVGAKKIVAPILEKRCDTPKIPFAAAEIKRSR
jgi:SAM-dependent methyltransferase